MTAQKVELIRFLQKYLAPAEIERVLELVGTLTAIAHSDGRRANDMEWRAGLKSGEIVLAPAQEN